MERQGKMEMAAKERETQRLQIIPKKWNRREEYEFLRVLTGYGVDLQSHNIMGTPLQPDWNKFKQMAHLERKSDETLSDYYKVFIAMCKRQAGVKLNDNERGLEGIIEDINEDHARLVLDRLELLSKLREVARHPQLDERLKQCMMNADTPDWWEPGRHDKELIAAVLKHGLYRSETFIFNDPNFSFADSEKRFIRELEAQIQRSIKLEAFNAKKAPPAPALVKNEVIDLDAEDNENSAITTVALKTETTIDVPVKIEIKSEASNEEAKDEKEFDISAEKDKQVENETEKEEQEQEKSEAELVTKSMQMDSEVTTDTTDIKLEETTKSEEKSVIKIDKTVTENGAADVVELKKRLV